MRKAILMTMLLFLSSLAASAQSCLHIQNGMSYYEAVSTDGTNVYATVYLDGADNMTTSPPCPSQVPGAPRHTATVDITLTSGSGQKSPTVYGNYTGCYNCYLSANASAELPIGSDKSWTANEDGQVICSSAGLLLGWNLPWYVDLHLTTGQNYGSTTDPKDGDPIGIYYPSCNIGQTEVCPLPNPSTGDRGWEVEFGKGEAIWPYAKTYFLAAHWTGSNNQYNVIEACVQDPISSPTTGPLGTCY